MLIVDSYLFFDGTCAEAMRFYQATLGGEIEMMMTHEESPLKDETPPGNAARILHASLKLGNARLMASDAMVGHPYEGMKGFALSLTYPTPAEAGRVFDLLAKGGKVTMPMAKTFWSDAFGMLTDRYGTPWMVTCAHDKV